MDIRGSLILKSYLYAILVGQIFAEIFQTFKFSNSYLRIDLDINIGKNHTNLKNVLDPKKNPAY